MPFLTIVALAIGAAVLYGEIHDQVTARVCLEYFTVAHPPVIISNSPTLQALVWGVLATWWVGLLLGVPLAVVARTGDYPSWSARQLVKPIATLLAVMGGSALIMGLLGFALATRGRVTIDEGWIGAISPDQYNRFIAVAWAHNTSYLVGFIGGIILCLRVWLARCGPALREGLQ